MTDLRVIGCDPGPTPGIVCLDFSAPGLLEVQVFQCSRNAASLIVDALIRDVRDPLGGRCEVEDVLVQVEQYVVGRRSGRSSSAGAGADTRELIGELQRVCNGWGIHPTLLAAGHVKPWATDERLDAAGLLAPTKGMRHAKDAARHALFRAVKSGGVPDPLSHDWAYGR